MLRCDSRECIPKIELNGGKGSNLSHSGPPNSRNKEKMSVSLKSGVVDVKLQTEGERMCLLAYF